jgi:hypothetical protein
LDFFHKFWDAPSSRRRLLHDPAYPQRPSHQEHAFAGGLGVEQTVGFLGLVELPLMREQAVDIDLALDAEPGAFGLALP